MGYNDKKNEEKAVGAGIVLSILGLIAKFTIGKFSDSTNANNSNNRDADGTNKDK